MKYGIYIGGVDSNSVNAITEGVMKVLQAPHADELTKRAALKVLQKGCQSPQYTTVSNVSINSGIDNDDLSMS